MLKLVFLTITSLSTIYLFNKQFKNKISQTNSANTDFACLPKTLLLEIIIKSNSCPVTYVKRPRYPDRAKVA